MNNNYNNGEYSGSASAMVENIMNLFNENKDGKYACINGEEFGFYGSVVLDGEIYDYDNDQLFPMYALVIRYGNNIVFEKWFETKRWNAALVKEASEIAAVEIPKVIEKYADEIKADEIKAENKTRTENEIKGEMNNDMIDIYYVQDVNTKEFWGSFNDEEKANSVSIEKNSSGHHTEVFHERMPF